MASLPVPIRETHWSTWVIVWSESVFIRSVWMSGVLLIVAYGCLLDPPGRCRGHPFPAYSLPGQAPPTGGMNRS